MSEHRIACFKCQNVWTFEPPLSRRDECPACHSDAKVCRNCRHFDAGAHHECREEQAEWVKEKEKGNFCAWFEANSQGFSLDGEASKAREKLEQFFSSAQHAAPVNNPGASLAEQLKAFLNGKK